MLIDVFGLVFFSCFLLYEFTQNEEWLDYRWIVRATLCFNLLGLTLRIINNAT
jgi:hypothetical protein